jgi:hypothetical protein
MAAGLPHARAWFEVSAGLLSVWSIPLLKNHQVQSLWNANSSF